MKIRKSIHLLVLLLLINCFRPPLPNDINEWEYVGLEEDNISTINSIVFHPLNQSTIYVCTSYNYNLDIFGYILKSTDAGMSWDTLSKSFNGGANFYDVLFHPFDDNKYYVLNGLGLYQHEGDYNWINITNEIELVVWETILHDFIIDPEDASVMYAGTTGRWGGSLYKSTNSGENWRRIESDKIGRIEQLFMHPNNHNKIFSIANGVGDLLVSSDAGETWDYTGLNNTLVYINDILFDRSNSNIMYATVDYDNRTLGEVDLRWGVMKSTDGGLTWERDNEGLPDSVWFKPMDIVQDESNKELYLNVYADSMYVYHKFSNELNWKKIKSFPRDEAGFGHLKLSPSGDYLYFHNHGIYKMALH